MDYKSIEDFFCDEKTNKIFNIENKTETGFNIKKIEYELLKRNLRKYGLNKVDYNILLNNKNTYCNELVYQDISYC